MRSKSTLAPLLFCLAVTQAQLVTGQGLKFGMVSSKLQADRDATLLPLDFPVWEDLHRRVGPQIGVFVDFFARPALGLQVEVSFLEKGAEQEIAISTIDHPEGTGERFTIDLFQYDFLAFSVLAQPRLKLGAVTPYAVAGPSLHWLIADREGLFGDTQNLTPALVAGAGVELQKPLAFPVLFEIRYHPDLVNFFESGRAKFKFRLWQFLLGINLRKR